MKITAFEVREDERPFFEKLARDQHLDLVLCPDPLKMKNLRMLTDSAGISVLGRSRLDAGILDCLKERGVRYISTRTIGYNHIDVEYARSIGLKVSNADYAPNGVADYAVMLMLMSLRNYKQALYRGNVNDYSLPGLEGREMRNLTVGIVGVGKIGRTVIENLRGFGCRILAFNRHPVPDLENQVTFVPLDTLYRDSDIISLHVPLHAQTYHMIDRSAMSQMKDGVILINTARGELIDMEALLDGIETKKIGALGLDVIENEEGIYHKDRRTDIISNREMAYLRQFPNVTMTQHMAFYTIEAVESMVSCGVRNLLEFEKCGSCRLEL
ncbi:D-isomer specific 2-hydroxyacid dehydrogenase family protein [Diplocloster agilis]|uniref:D-isomer specific 2-hydroxyacid dehydrogenase family protein n=1 Tax=Diplocloster agilis TaxID=2850323 RepID=UPI00082081CB|nr:D-isomer specific 2-hydroxyacid dehydrogenase family protein [Suonthocola fibrivorans]MCU6733818.1 D-isomer specific 2-hydroxyacid dehydrogenase family protein [Suonthocola fibrivorans]SCJ10086.1 D-specific alpha-keto acid dehydrogenase [uncultured Clostridium sp.]